ncbi:recombinase family protein [Candidatus Enterococcus ikei]|uniref:Recombinase family protein n=1 Tax=Candidatus Enterococcus ikei TaxID=2815326 RepID=A0ABS3GXK6_9ENTE|nr:recombinase family protein [Enterococcus sp. DIV0869a]MBO0439997.1 recombinase family protein [Enterococcus sp. DIV0869a]
MTVIGYMRVSTHYQKFDSQQQALEEYGVDIIFKEHESGRKVYRNELNKALDILKPGDTFVIFKLDRLARGTKQLLMLLEKFNDQNINFVSIENNIDTSTPMGRFFFTIMGAFAEMEAELIRERVLAGLSAAKKNGVILGRPPLVNEVNQAIYLYHNTDIPIDEISKRCGISISTIYHHLRKDGIYRTKKTGETPKLDELLVSTSKHK